jgi:hypothetical protein
MHLQGGNLSDAVIAVGRQISHSVDFPEPPSKTTTILTALERTFSSLPLSPLEGNRGDRPAVV